MKKRMLDGKADLKHMDHREVLIMSRGLAEKTNAEVAAAMGLGEETVARYQRAPMPGEYAYDLGLGRIALWVRSVGNDLVPQWIAQQCGGVFSRVEGIGTKNADILQQLGNVQREHSHVMEAMIEALRDGQWSEAEKESIEKELTDLRRSVDEALQAVRGRMGLG